VRVLTPLWPWRCFSEALSLLGAGLSATVLEFC
jgi:hypothetical protein